MTDSNGKPIKQITEAAAGKEKYYIIHYRDGSCRTFTRQTGTIKKWLSTQPRRRSKNREWWTTASTSVIWRTKTVSPQGDSTVT